jgi:DnaK suppressor protein
MLNEQKEGVINKKGNSLPVITLVDLEPDYDPLKDDNYMGSKHKTYFYSLLIEMRNSMIKEIDNINDTIDSISEFGMADEVDQATKQTELSFYLHKRERALKLIERIDMSIQSIYNNSYGYCVETKQKIGVERMMARPTAKYCIQVQEKYETY